MGVAKTTRKFAVRSFSVPLKYPKLSTLRMPYQTLTRPLQIANQARYWQARFPPEGEQGQGRSCPRGQKEGYRKWRAQYVPPDLVFCPRTNFVLTVSFNTVREVAQAPSSMFFQHNTALVPPYQVLVDTNFLSHTVSRKIELLEGMMDALYAKCEILITSCVMAGTGSRDLCSL